MTSYIVLMNVYKEQCANFMADNIGAADTITS